MRSVAVAFDQRRLMECEIAEPSRQRSTEVIFRIQEVGVCGTDRDLAMFRLGRPPDGESYLVLGHEALGQVVETGAAVRDLATGDWVVPTVRRACPGCESCARGRRDLCLTGQYTERGIFGRHGYFTAHAVDEAEDLVRIPSGLIDCAILIEPLSVVEKAIERAFEVHSGEPVRALVLGAGPVGILAALVLQQRGLSVDVFSLESREHPRVRLLKEAGIGYRERLDESRADLVIEAAGSADLAFEAIQSLAPLGVLVLLGAKNSNGNVPFLNMIVGNQSIVGSVNASPRAFDLALQDLARIERRWLLSLIERQPFGAFNDTILGPPRTAAKLVHSIGD